MWYKISKYPWIKAQEGRGKGMKKPLIKLTLEYLSWG
jgi:hypothetical protein